MKKLLLIAPAILLFFAACSNKKDDTLSTQKQIVFTDTALLNNANASTDVATPNVAPALVEDKVTVQPKPKVVTITKIIRVKEKAQTAPPVVYTPPPVQQAPAPVYEAPAQQNGETLPGNTDVSTAPIETPKKQGGWSQAAKGATIGGVGGAVAGAIIGKKKGKSAIIGGVIGAAGGYIIGRKADKNSGRVQYVGE